MARRNSYLLFAALVLAAFPINTAGATVWGDTFNGTVIDTLQWEISAPLGDSTVTQKNALLLTSDGTGGEFCNTPEPLGPGAGIALRKRLAGDFDIQVDFRNFSAPSSGLTQAFLNVYQDPSNKLHIKRQREYDVDSIQTISVVNGQWLDCTVSPTQTTSGTEIPEGATFRIRRSGSTIETFLNGARDCLIEAAFDGPVIVSLVLLGPGLEAGMASVAFDNFRINSGTLVGPILVCSPPEPCTPPPPDLVSWWSGDGNAEDRMNNNPGTAENGTTYGTGKVRQAFSFDGVDDFVNVPDSPTLDAITTEITVDFWIRPQQPDKNVWIFARRDPLVSEGFSVLILPGGELGINLRTDSAPYYGTGYRTAPIVQFGEWQHVAVTANIPRGQVDAYVNGNWIPLELTLGPTVSGQLVNVNNLFIGRRQSSDIGEGPVGGGHYVGEIDEVELFGRALSQAEIQAIYNAGTAGKCETQVGVDIKPGSYPNTINLGSCGKVPVAILSAPDAFDATMVDPTTVRLAGAGPALKGNGAAMASVQDVSGDGLMDLVVHFNTKALQLTASDTMAVLTGGTFGGTTFGGTDSVRIVGSGPPPCCTRVPSGLTGWWPGDGNTKDIVGRRNAVLRGDATIGLGFVDQAFHLDGDGDWVEVPHAPALNVGTGDFTIDLWVYFNDTAGEQVLVEKYIQRFNGPSAGWTLTKLEDNVVGLFGGEPSGETAGVASCGPLPIPARTWNHFAATRKGNQYTLFMNGVLVGGAKGNIVNLNSTSSLKFGHRGNPTDTPDSEDDRNFFLNGRIDEVELFVGRALSQEEIQGIFNAGRAGKCKKPGGCK